ncbi:MAG: DUF421 domain-containing protein [Chloroflexota bacterium]
MGGQHGFLSDLFFLTYRTVALYFVSLLAVRLMGKRTVANLAPFDLVVIIIMGSIAAIPIEEREIDLLHGLWPIALLSAFQFVMALLNMRFRPVERVTQGISTLLIKEGQIQEDNLKKERMTMADLIIVLREKDVTNLDDVWEARLEPTGNVSVIKKKETQPITPKDLETKSFASVDLVIERNLERLRGELQRVIDEARHDPAKGSDIKKENNDVQ